MRVLPLVLLALLLAGCTASPLRPDRDRAPTHVPVDPMTLPEPVPQLEPRSAVGNHSPYTVFGKQYRVLESADGYAARGNASWYGQKFHGRSTSSGEPFDMYAFSAAHRSLPLPTWVRVTNEANGRSLTVRVNDRGPFHHNRILDLSWAAAVRLGFVDQGVAPVRVEVIDTAPPVPEPQWQPETVAAPAVDPLQVAPVAAAPEPEPAVAAETIADRGADMEGAWYLQAGAFQEVATATRFQRALAALVQTRVLMEAHPEQALHRVRVGPLDRAEAERLQALIITADMGVPLLVHDPSSVPASCVQGAGEAAC